MSGTFYGSFADRAAESASQIGTVVEITLNDATWYGGVDMYLSDGVANARGHAYRPIVTEWGEPRRGFDVQTSNLTPLEMSVTIANEGEGDTAATDVRDALENGNQRGSVASVWWVIPGNASDYALRFTGILERWSWKAGEVILTIRTDDAALRSFLPNWQLTASEWPHIPAVSIGVQVPLIYGTHDSTGLSGTGMVPCFPVYEQAEVGIWWHVVCLGQAKDVLDVYVNGTIKTEGIGNDYLTAQTYMRAGKSYTLIVWVSAVAPGSVVTADVKGYETTGNTAAVNAGFSDTNPTGTLVDNPVEQMRHLLVNHAEGVYRSGAWSTGAGSLIDVQSWAEAAQWAEAHGLEGAGYLGGTVDRKMVGDILNAWLNSYPCFRAYWTVAGKIALRVLSLDFPGYRGASSPPLLTAPHELGEDGSFAYDLDTTSITDSYSASYLYGQAFGDYFSSITVIDPDVDVEVSTSFEMPWSLARAT